MLVRGLFWLAVVWMLAPHEPDLGIARTSDIHAPSFDIASLSRLAGLSPAAAAERETPAPAARLRAPAPAHRRTLADVRAEIIAANHGRTARDWLPL